MNYSRLKRFLLFLGLMVSVFCNCKAETQLTDFQAGNVLFDTSATNEISQALIYSYVPLIPFSKTPSVAVAIQEFAINNQDIGQFHVKVNKIRQNIIELAFLFKYGSWKRIKISLWIAARTDFVMGSIKADFGSLRGAKGSSVLQLKSPMPNYSLAISRVFINGFSFNLLQSLQLFVSIDSLLEKTLHILIEVGQDFDLKVIYLSYLIFNPSDSGILSYQGAVLETNLLDRKSVSIHQTIGDSSYLIFGITGIKLMLKMLQFQSVIDHDFVLSLRASQRIKSIQISYAVIGKSSKKVCEKCETGNKQQGPICLAKCPLDSFEHIYEDKGISCQRCSYLLNLRINMDKTGCQCLSEYELKDKSCVLLSKQGQKQESSPKLLVISAESNQNHKDPLTHDIQSRENKTRQYSDTQLVLENNCKTKSNSYWTGKQCLCQVGYKQQNSLCVPIVSQQILELYLITLQDFSFNTRFQNQNFVKSTSSKITRTQCGSYSEWSQIDQVCICLKGYVKRRGSCELCPEGFFAIGELCATCPPNSAFDLQTLYCNCKPGFEKNSIGSCVCPSGTEIFEQTCINICSQTERRNPQGRCIQKECPKNQILFQGSCECLHRYTRSKSSGLCTLNCPTGQFDFNGICAVCVPNSTFNNVVGSCVCNSGFFMKGSICIQDPKKCSIGSYYSQPTNNCLLCHQTCKRCITAQQCVQCKKVESTIKKQLCYQPTCGDGSIEGQQICDDGNTKQKDGCSPSCKVEEGYSCSQRPSKCLQIQVKPQDKKPVEEQNQNGTQTPKTIPNASLTLEGTVQINSQNVFVNLITMPIFTFPSSIEGRQFIKVEFGSKDAQPSFKSCIQNTKNLASFRCILTYNSGLPNNMFKVKFFFSKDGYSAVTEVNVDPLNNSFNLRSLK